MKFEPIPSLGYRYEIDAKGNLRNAKTKRLLKYRPVAGTPSVSIKVDGRKTTYSIPSLIWEVFGVYSNAKIPVGVTIQKSGEVRYFRTMYQCSIWLEPKIFIGRRSIQNDYLYRRRPEIHGWQIFYHEPKNRKSPSQNAREV